MIYVYSAPNCVQCSMTKKVLERQKLEFEIIDVSSDESALESLKNEGFLSVPVVKAGDQVWSGFRPERLKNLASN